MKWIVSRDRRRAEEDRRRRDLPLGCALYGAQRLGVQVLEIGVKMMAECIRLDIALRIRRSALSGEDFVHCSQAAW